MHAIYECPDGTPFPVDWPDEDGAQRAWAWDQMHCPDPLTPMSVDFNEVKSDGFVAGFHSIGIPASPLRINVNGYSYAGARPPDPIDVEELRIVQKRDLRLRLEHLVDLWESRYRPEVEALVRSIRAWAGPEDSLATLAGRFDELTAAVHRLGQLHMIVIGPTRQAHAQFEAFCVSELGERGSRIATDATAGVPNKSLLSADALWGLSRTALELPAVAELLRKEPLDQLADALSHVEGGQDFQGHLDAFLDTFGHRNESFSELSLPTWKEEPGFVFLMLRRYVDAPESRSPRAMHDAATATRERVTAETLAALDPSKHEEFSRLQRIALQRTTLIEDHNYHIDQRGHVAVRVPLLMIGARLVDQQAIDEPSDVFYLHMPEVEQAASDASARFQAVVAERREQREFWLRRLPPATIGEGEARRDEYQRAFFGPIVAEPSEAGTLRGLAASGGVIRGTARLIRSLDEAEKLEPGDILVTYSTAPPWTPLFAIAGAVVTDSGGPLSHCAIVAREYGIPAVTGTVRGTSEIVDGSVITVDGSEGIVRMER